jgi:hypothetical protein
MGFVDIIDRAMYDGSMLRISTKRGEITGTPYCVDEYETDKNRLGYCIQTGKNNEYTVFIDEIIDVSVITKTDVYIPMPLREVI